jgi:hypothetical protein
VKTSRLALGIGSGKGDRGVGHLSFTGNLNPSDSRKRLASATSGKAQSAVGESLIAVECEPLKLRA